MGLPHNLQSLCPGEQPAFCISSLDVLRIQWVWTYFKNPMFVQMQIACLTVPWHVKNSVDWHVTRIHNGSCCSSYEWPSQTAVSVTAMESLEADMLLNGGDLLPVLGKGVPMWDSFSRHCLHVPAPAYVREEAWTVDLPLNYSAITNSAAELSSVHPWGCSTKLWVAVPLPLLSSCLSPAWLLRILFRHLFASLYSNFAVMF